MEQDKNTSARVDPAVLAGIHRQLDDHLSGDDAKLMINLGYAFEKGETVREPVRQNYLAAAACYEAAARLGDAVALNNLGWLYQNGFGVPQDVDTAIRLYTEAADKGESTAMINLGNIYENGLKDGTPDYEQAFYWYGKGARKVDCGAMFNYARCLHHGLGTPQDRDEAFRVFEMVAALFGYIPAYFYVGLHYEYGWAVPQDYEKARRFYTYGAKNGETFCWTQLGGMYANGLGIPVDFRKAKHCYLKAANAGDDLGYYNLGWLYEHGDLGEPDLKTAVALYKMGAYKKDKHSIRALVRLGYATVTP